MDKSRLNIITMFRKRRFLTPCSADLLSRYAKRWQVSGFEAILDTHVFSEQTLANLIGESFKVDRIFNLAAMELSLETVRKLDYQTARKNECLVLSFGEQGEGVTEVAFADPTDYERVQEISAMLGGEITLAVAERSDIVRAIHGKYRLTDQLPILQVGQKSKEIQTVKDL